MILFENFGNYAASHKSFAFIAWCAMMTLAPAALAQQAIPAPPQVAARSWCLAVQDDGQVLDEYRGHKVFEPSGLAKLMTLYLVFEAIEGGRLDLHEQLSVDEEAWRAPGSRMFLKLNTLVRVDDLIAGLILYNANDATTVLTNHLAGGQDKFVERMNQRANLMKMHQTIYTHPAGLQDPNSTTTACEQLTLMKYLRNKFPQYLHFFSMPYHNFLGSTRNNPNSLLRDTEGVAGMSMIQTNDNRFHAAVSVSRNSLDFNFVLLGAGSRRSSHMMSASLINHFYHHYRKVQIFQRNESLRTVEVWHGEEDELRLGALEVVSVIIPFSRNDELDIYISVQDSIEAPVRRGERLGNIRISYQDNVLTNSPLVALHSIKRTHWFGRMWDSIKRLFN